MKNIWKWSILSMLSMALISCQSPTDTNSSASPNPGTSVAPSAGASATPNPGTSVKPSEAPASSTGTSGLTFSYVGLDADKVSQGDVLVPDKANDLHFTANYNFATEISPSFIAIFQYENGKAVPTSGWAAGTSLNWVLAVETNGKVFNATKVQSLGKLSGNVKFDFYGSNAPIFNLDLTKPGTSFQLVIAYMEAGKQVQLTQVTTIK